MTLRKVVCPTCNYTGTGSASIKGPTCAAGMCPDCLGYGEVTEAKRERLLAKAAAAKALTEPLRAFTVRQPYAWAIARGWKLVENRTRLTSHRGDIAIHAGAAWFKGAEADERVRRAWWGGDLGTVDPAELGQGWFGVVVAVAELWDAHVPILGCCDSEWAEPDAGAHWMLRNVRRLDEHVPAKGALGVWMLPPDLAERVTAATPPAPDDYIHGPAPTCPDCGHTIGETEPTVRRTHPWSIAHEQCPEGR